MTGTRIHDLAVELGISSEQLLKTLSELGIHVRSHMSALEPGQVALVRARREREKRKKDEPEPKKGRRRAPVATPAQTPTPAPAPEATTAAAPVAAPVAPKRAPKAAKPPEPPVEDADRPRRRRRTAAEVAAKEAVAEEERQREAAELAIAEVPLKLEPLEPKPTLEERAAALFVEPPATFRPEPASPAATSAPSVPVESVPAHHGEIPREAPRPQAFIPMRVQRNPAPARPRPVASAAPGSPSSSPPSSPRPIASAAPGGGSIADDRRDKKKRKKGKRSQVDVEAVQANITRTMASINSGPAKKGARRRDDEPSFRKMEEQRMAEEREREKTLVRVNEFITVSELSETIKVPPTQIVTFAFKELGLMVTVNQRLDFDQIELIASEFGFQAVKEEQYAPQSAGPAEPPDTDDQLVSRPPVVTVMGHVDHGKTSLLDYVRKTNVIAGEAGGITQHIGAYHVERPDGKRITFLDTPGHQAFTAMRARGAQVTDLVVLVVAADDQVMPQTIEAISHAKNAGVPIVVAINKIDLPAANVQKVKQDLLTHGVVLEEFGGQTLSAAISAKQGTGVDALLEKVLLQAEMLDKKANPNRAAKGTVIESSLDPGKGTVATVLVQNGTLKVGTDIICGNLSGRIRAMFDERGKRVEEAGPSMPVQILGLDGIPQAGDVFVAVANAQEARDIAQKRQRLDREAQHRRQGRGVSLEDLSRQIGEGKVRVLNIIIKADQGGPAEALADAFAQLSNAEVRIEVIHRGVGAITDSDVLLARTANAIIVGFHVRPDANARATAEREKVDIRTYRVIYEAVEEVRAALEGLLAPEKREVVLGEAEVRQVFKISGIGTIAGCHVRNGLIKRGTSIRVVRDAVEVFSGGISSLKRFKEDVREVKEGLECGIGVENFNDIKVGDILESFKVEEVARLLEPAGATKGS